MSGSGLRWTILGSGTSSGVPVIGCDCATCRSGDPRDKRLRASVMIERREPAPARIVARIVIDTSNDFREQMLRHEARRVDAILFTHHHYDHISGFDDIRALNYMSRAPVECYATETTFNELKRFFAYAFAPRPAEGGGVPLTRLHTIEPGKPFTVAGVEITPIPLLHGSMEVMGYRAGNTAYCTDCNAIPETSYRLLEGLETLILDALRYRKHSTHFSVEEATAAARRIGAKRTFFTHIAHEIKHAEAEEKLPPAIRIAYDGMAVAG